MQHYLKKLRQTIPPLMAVCVVGLLSGCLDEGKTNPDKVSYTPETRILGVIAGEGAEYQQGAQVTLAGRLIGTVTNQTVLWEQIEGDPIPGITDWTKPNLSFTAPAVDGLKSYKFQISARDPQGAIVNGSDGKPLVDQVSIVIYDPAVIRTIEVEDTSFASLVGGATLVGQGDNNFISGAIGKHTADITPGAKAVFTIASGSMAGDKPLNAGFYTLYVRYAIPGSYGGKVGVVTVNGVESQMQFNASGAWEKFRVGTVKLNDGDNTIEIGGGWNYYRIDSISLIPAPAPAKPLAVAPTLSNPAATDAAKDLMTFLVSSYGAKTISGQTEYMDYGSNKTGLRDFNKVVELTGGAAPAITAFDFIDYSSSRVACGAKHGNLSEDMIAAHKDKNVILAPLWHWNAPTKLIDTNCSGSGNTAWYSGFYSTATTFDLKAALANPNGADYQALLADIDTISAELKKFADADIPLLWRPLHEAQGAWFWWGKSGPDELKALWKLMHDRMTKEHGLNNLIWVFTYSGSADASWYPGDDYVDIVGYDGYDGKNANNPFKSQFDTIKDRHDGKKLVGLTETGTVPNVELMQTQNAWWAFFITWNSENSSEYGPVNADATALKASYSFANTINLDSVPGGRVKQEAGLFTGFEIPTGDWGAQVSWSNTTGIKTSGAWSASGLNSLSLTKDLSKESSPSNVVFQTYPTGGLDVSGKTKLKVTVNSTGSGAGTTAYLFVKYGKDWTWASTSAVPANGGAIELDITGFDTLAGYGLVFEGFDKTSTAANFYIDKVELDGKVIQDFEPDTSGWAAQVSWSDTAGATLSNAWKNSGQRSLALIKDLSKENAPSNVVFQTYPEGGIDVSAASKLSIAVNAADAGAGTTAYVFVKHGANWEWASTSAVSANATTIDIDVSGYDTLAGYGVVFENFDKSSTAATFYIDSVKLDDSVLNDFEGTGAWEFQVNWSPAVGLQLASDWVASGNYSLAGFTQLKTGDDNIILQTYPTGGLLLGSVTKLKITAHAANAGSNVQAQLFAKDKDWNWSDGGAVALVDGTATLTLDISSLKELKGFGVRFMGPVNADTPSSYYLDDVTFE